MESLPEKMTQEIERLRLYVDKHGRPIDEKILFAVAALRFNGFKTTMSCAGHIRNKRWPWIEIESPEAPLLLKKMQDGAHSGPEFHENRRVLVEANRKESTRLYELLKKFYESHSTSYPAMLIVEERGPGYARLLPHNSYYIGSALSDEEFAEWLENAQAEINSFTAFLTKT